MCKHRKTDVRVLLSFFRAFIAVVSFSGNKNFLCLVLLFVKTIYMKQYNICFQFKSVVALVITTILL